MALFAAQYVSNLSEEDFDFWWQVHHFLVAGAAL
jgi:hypothetical protein